MAVPSHVADHALAVAPALPPPRPRRPAPRAPAPDRSGRDAAALAPAVRHTGPTVTAVSGPPPVGQARLSVGPRPVRRVGGTGRRQAGLAPLVAGPARHDVPGAAPLGPRPEVGPAAHRRVVAAFPVGLALDTARRRGLAPDRRLVPRPAAPAVTPRPDADATRLAGPPPAGRPTPRVVALSVGAADSPPSPPAKPGAVGGPRPAFAVTRRPHDGTGRRRPPPTVRPARERPALRPVAGDAARGRPGGRPPTREAGVLDVDPRLAPAARRRHPVRLDGDRTLVPCPSDGRATRPAETPASDPRPTRPRVPFRDDGTALGRPVAGRPPNGPTVAAVTGRVHVAAAVDAVLRRVAPPETGGQAPTGPVSRSRATYVARPCRPRLAGLVTFAVTVRPFGRRPYSSSCPDTSSVSTPTRRKGGATPTASFAVTRDTCRNSYNSTSRCGYGHATRCRFVGAGHSSGRYGGPGRSHGKS